LSPNFTTPCLKVVIIQPAATIFKATQPRRGTKSQSDRQNDSKGLSAQQNCFSVTNFSPKSILFSHFSIAKAIKDDLNRKFAGFEPLAKMQCCQLGGLKWFLVPQPL
jgi:hypothetical protein